MIKNQIVSSEDRWENLCQMCRNDVLRVHQVSDTSVFEATLEAGLRFALFAVLGNMSEKNRG